MQHSDVGADYNSISNKLASQVWQVLQLKIWWKKLTIKIQMTMFLIITCWTICSVFCVFCFAYFVTHKNKWELISACRAMKSHTWQVRNTALWNCTTVLHVDSNQTCSTWHSYFWTAITFFLTNMSLVQVKAFFSVFVESEGNWKRSKEKFPYSMTLHRNVRSFGANNQGQGWEKQVFLAQPIWQVQGKINRNSEKLR